ncbi:MAG: 5-aminovalerate aminotransferase DavT [Alphaproteobacteria bacterium MarineAlpha5_Bin7]|nr:MAG: 5-aminovalerate aminotransferase DavT [Alphaproteobacteria bacterium MarineAlpha5_Bin7]
MNYIPFMSVFDVHPPIIDNKQLIRWLKTNFSFLRNKAFHLKKLNSERDINYIISIKNKKNYVLKISNPSEKLDILNYQDRLIKHLRKNNNLKKYIPKIYHSKIVKYIDKKNRECFVRILSFIDGQMYGDIKSNEKIENSLGSLLANTSIQFKSFIDPIGLRKFIWNPADIDWIKKEINIFSGKNKSILLKAFSEYEEYVKNNLKNLRYSITHSDPNNYNLVVKNNKINGLLDYGDSIYGPTINDLAICLSYALMNNKNIFSTLKNIILAYHKKFPISEDEIYSLISLSKSRLMITVVMAKKQRNKYPSNQYLSISEQDAWNLLEKLNKIPTNFLIYIIKNICGFPILKNYNNIISYLKNTKFDNIFNFHLLDINKSILKLDSQSSLLKGNPNNQEINKRMKKVYSKDNSKVGIGLYKEKRKVYKGTNFASLLDENRRRDIHLGIDIFINQGTSLYSPIDGKIVILENNSFKYDYGPTLVLEHKHKNIKFYTLYGHLSKITFSKLKIGKKIKKGDWIGKIGKTSENGNWLPHLHFQIILDLMNNKENFPGVGEEFLIDIWSKISPDPNFILGIPDSFFSNNINFENILKKRKKNISKNFSISYDKPLHMLEAKDQFFFDRYGRRYLDCVNNISHVGHSNVHIHNSLVRQNLKLNTNTRYLYNIINKYSDKLLSKFPKKLNKIFFVCTGSEANDLAYRIAQTYTKAKDVFVIDNAYHGHTNSLIDLSPYKFKGKGGLGQKDYVHILDMPEPIRGKWKYKDKNWSEKYIDDAIKEIQRIAKDKKISCLFAESILGCGGQVVIPKNYLKKIFLEIRKNKALCIIDEVQTGFGRVGSDFWSFQEHKVIPDIVTLGKPMGNGHPLAAVVTTEKIATAFNNGMEYFNSFGGNPVSCAVGYAVLEVIENKKLQKNAYQVGKYFFNKLLKIRNKNKKYISDVRGRGLFLGIDIIENYDNLKPSANLAKKIINFMKNNGILLSTDGPYNNVIKIKPPLVFNKADVDFVCEKLSEFFKKI